MATRKLATRVAVGGKWYGPDDDVPDDVAARITNPKAWAVAEDADTDGGQPKRAGTSSGARLASRVSVGGKWYGPDDEVPDDVAARITNPKAWEGGTLPTLAASEPAGDGGDDSVKGPAPASDPPPSGDVAGDEGGGVVAPASAAPDGDVAGDTGSEDAEPAEKPRRGRRG